VLFDCNPSVEQVDDLYNLTLWEGRIIVMPPRYCWPVVVPSSLLVYCDTLATPTPPTPHPTPPTPHPGCVRHSHGIIYYSVFFPIAQPHLCCNNSPTLGSGGPAQVQCGGQCVYTQPVCWDFHTTHVVYRWCDSTWPAPDVIVPGGGRL